MLAHAGGLAPVRRPRSGQGTLAAPVLPVAAPSAGRLTRSRNSPPQRVRRSMRSPWARAGLRLPGRGSSLPFFDPIPALIDRRLVRPCHARPFNAIVSLPLLRWRRPPPRRVSRLEGG